MRDDELTTALALHYRRRPGLEPQDVYKLIYQRVFGPEHLIGNTRAAKEQLYHEVLHLPDTPSRDHVLDPLSPVLCRVNLQPFVRHGGAVEVLWQVCRQTLREFQPGTFVDLERQWRRFLATSWATRYAPEVLSQFWQRMATADFPPIHHSRVYAEAYVPHYRVVLQALLAGQPGFDA